MAKINFNVIREQLQRPLEENLREKAIRVAETHFHDAKQEFLDSFANDPVSLEIRQGPGLAESPTMGIAGNLFGFLGFQEGTTPIQDLYQFLDRSIKLNHRPTYNRATQTYSFQVTTPSKEDIEQVTPMEWGTGRSWVFAIESGISGINHYLFTRLAETSRSTAGIQVKATLNAGGFTARSYLSPLLNFLKKSLEK